MDHWEVRAIRNHGIVRMENERLLVPVEAEAELVILHSVREVEDLGTRLESSVFTMISIDQPFKMFTGWPLPPLPPFP